MPSLRHLTVFLAFGLQLSALTVVALRAAEPADLGDGLGYLRVHSLEEAVKPLAGGKAIVLDLRRATTTPETVALFSSALAARPTGSRLFVLVGPDTPPDIARALTGNLIILGIKDAQPKPHVVVQQSAEDDRRAYDALASGTALAELISGKIEKERYDEASLVQEFKNGNLEARPPVSVPAKTVEPDKRTVDRVLQRAVHLHQALTALNR
jgi:hypothetical protein